MLSFSISNKSVSELRELSQKAAKKQSEISQMDQAELDYIHRQAFISMIGASTRIENAILTDSEVDWLDTVLTKDSRTTAFEDRRDFIENKLSKDRARSIEEVAGSRALLNLIYTQAAELNPLSETALRALHAELLQYYPPSEIYRGRYKIAPNRVVRKNHSTGEETSVLEPAEPGSITESAMHELIKWYNQSLQDCPWTIAVATEFVFRFLAIHPFQDGNGRMGRGLFLLAMLQSPDESLRVIAPYLPIDRHIEKQRADYYTVLRRCSGGKFHPNPSTYDLEPFLRFMMKATKNAFEDFAFYRRRYLALEHLSPATMLVLNCFKEHPETKLQRKDILGATKLPRATVTLALKTLSLEGFIQRQGRGAGVRYYLVF